MEEEKKTELTEIKTDIELNKFELSEMRAAFCNLVNEMRKQSQDFNSGLRACQQAFHRCKDSYDNCKRAFSDLQESLDEDLTDVANGMANIGWGY